MKKLVQWHLEHYPAMEPQDVVKLVFQAKLGCGHLLSGEEMVTNRIIDEESNLTADPDEPLTTPLGEDYVRLNLRRAMADGIPAQWIARLMMLSLPKDMPPRSVVVSALAELNMPELLPQAKRLEEETHWIPSHTASYHQMYAPAYRVISRECAKALPVLTEILHKQSKDRLLVCIDGRCGSGKTTLAHILQKVLDASVVSMDDFFLPHPKKTPERLAQPGGNADWERLVQEFLHPWLESGAGSYRKYNCHADAMGESVVIPESKVVIIEGTYSLLPPIGKHADLRVYISISPEEQRDRILKRDGPRMLDMFIQRWIPLEEAYFSAYGLPDAQCIVIPQQSV